LGAVAPGKTSGHDADKFRTNSLGLLGLRAGMAILAPGKASILPGVFCQLDRLITIRRNTQLANSPAGAICGEA